MSFRITAGADLSLVNKQITQFNQNYKDPVDGRLASVLITGPGVKLPCYQDEILIDDYLSQVENFETGHPLVGGGSEPNPNWRTADLLFKVEGNIPEPSPETVESSRSCDPGTRFGDWSFSLDFTTYFHIDNMPRIIDINEGAWGEVFLTVRDGVGFKVPNPTLKLVTYVEGTELVVKGLINFTRSQPHLPWQAVPGILVNCGDPLFS